MSPQRLTFPVLACLSLAWAVLAPEGVLAADDPTDEGATVRVDRWGDPLPPRAIARMGTIRFRHWHHVMGVAFSPDGKRIASAGWDHSVRLWDLETGKQLRSFGPAGDKDNPHNPFAVSRWVCSVAFSPDGKMLACGEYAPNWRSGAIHLWDVAGGNLLHTFPGQRAGVRALAFSPDGKTLASGATDGSIRVWHVPGWSQFLFWSGSRGEISSLAFSRDGKYLAAAADPAIHIWELSGRRRIKQFSRNDAVPGGVVFAHDGKTLISGGTAICFWDIDGGKLLRQIRTGHTLVLNVALTPDGKTLASRGFDESVSLWDINAGKELHGLHVEGNVQASLAFSPDGRTLAAGGSDLIVHLWDVTTGKERRWPQAHHGIVDLVRFDRASRTLISLSRDQTLRRWEALTGKQVEEMPAEHRHVPHYPGSRLRAAAFSPDGRFLALGTDRGDIRIVNAINRQELKHLRQGNDVLSLAFSPDGSVLAAGTSDELMRRWDLAGGRELPPFKPVADARRAGAACVLFAPDGKTIFTQTLGEEVLAWKVANGECRSLEMAPDTIAGTLALSPDGKFLATGSRSGVVYVWETATAQIRWKLTGHSGYVNSLAFSADSCSLAAGCWRSIRVWESSTGRERLSFRDFEGDVFALAFSPNKRLLASGGANSTVLVWDFPGWTLHDRQHGKLTIQKLESLWQTLAGDDAAQAFRALLIMARNAAQAVPFLKLRVQPVPASERDMLKRLIRDLGSDKFAERDRAMRDLTKRGASAVPALRRALADSRSLEVRLRIEILLKRSNTFSSDDLRTLRVVEALEWMDSLDARRFLETLAQGVRGALLTDEAGRALRRLYNSRSGSGDE